jgi:hypothetical protein
MFSGNVKLDGIDFNFEQFTNELIHSLTFSCNCKPAGNSIKLMQFANTSFIFKIFLLILKF